MKAFLRPTSDVATCMFVGSAMWPFATVVFSIMTQVIVESKEHHHLVAGLGGLHLGVEVICQVITGAIIGYRTGTALGLKEYDRHRYIRYLKVSCWTGFVFAALVVFYDATIGRANFDRLIMHHAPAHFMYELSVEAAVYVAFAQAPVFLWLLSSRIALRNAGFGLPHHAG